MSHVPRQIIVGRTSSSPGKVGSSACCACRPAARRRVGACAWRAGDRLAMGRLATHMHSDVRLSVQLPLEVRAATCLTPHSLSRDQVAMC